MQVVSRCSVPATGFVWQPRPGAWTLTVVCKATFALLPDESPLAVVQQEIVWEDSHRDDDPRRSLHAATDLVPFKKAPELLVMGCAHAPAGLTAGRVRVRVAAGGIDKVADVYGDRFFDPEGRLSEPTKFEKIYLSWERASSGPHGQNPAGIPMGGDARPDGRGRVPVPNIVPAGSHIGSRGDVLPPVGFGPIAPSWPGRAERLPRDRAWDAAGWKERPLPFGLDPGYFNAAPADQLLTHLADNERITLEGLSAEHPVLVTRLKAPRPFALASIKGEPATPVPLTADTLLIDTDARTLTVTYRGQLPLSHPEREGWVVVTLQETDRAAFARAVDPTSDTLDVEPDAIEPELVEVDEVDMDETFAGSAPLPTAPPRSPSAPAGSQAAPPASAFRPPSEPVWVAQAHAAAEPREDASAALPFRRPTGAQVGGMALGRSARLKSLMALPPEPVRPAAAPVEIKAPSIVVATSPYEILDEQTADLPASAEPPPGQSRGLPRPPPVIVEPAAKVAPPAPAFVPPPALLSEPGPAQAKPAAPDTAATPQAPAEAPKAEPSITLQDFPLEKCAALDASLAHRPAEREALLQVNRLTEPEWQHLRGAWTDEIRRESKRGKSGLLRAYDAAYVAQLETERGPITVEEHARILVGMERGDPSEALRAAGLPDESAIRIQRLWIRKTATEPALGAALRSAVERARAD